MGDLKPAPAGCRFFREHPMSNTESHQDRVRAEKVELDERLAKLDAFILDNPMFRQLPEAEQQRLNKQSLVMAQYSNVLDERIEAFKTEVVATAS